MPADEVDRPQLGELDWSPARRADSLSRVFAHAIEAATATNPPTDAITAHLLALAQKLVLAVDATMLAETTAWMTDFRSALANSDHALSRPEHSTPHH
jgi:hypothetical protein